MSSGLGDDVALQSCSGGGGGPWRSVGRWRGGVASSVVVFDRGGDVEAGVGVDVVMVVVVMRRKCDVASLACAVDFFFGKV